MSIPFSSTTNKNGIIQLIEKNIGFNDGDISGNATLLAQFTADVNLAVDKATEIAIRSSGTWDWDDSNQTDYPIITTNLVSGQRDYSFITDGSSNLILEIKNVFILNASSGGVYTEIHPVDVASDTSYETGSFVDGKNTSGIPFRYDKLANAIFLDPIPNYNATNGLKIYISRESTYFTTADTTKKAGLAGILHEYLALRPSYQYAYRKSLDNVNLLAAELLKFEGDEDKGIVGSIARYYGQREKDERAVLSEASFNFR